MSWEKIGDEELLALADSHEQIMARALSLQGEAETPAWRYASMLERLDKSIYQTEQEILARGLIRNSS